MIVFAQQHHRDQRFATTAQHNAPSSKNWCPRFVLPPSHSEFLDCKDLDIADTPPVLRSAYTHSAQHCRTAPLMRITRDQGLAAFAHEPRERSRAAPDLTAHSGGVNSLDIV